MLRAIAVVLQPAPRRAIPSATFRSSSPQLGAGIGSRETRRQARPVASSGATGSAGPRDETPGPRPLRQRGGRRRRWLLRHASGSPVRLHVTADRAASKHIGDSRNPGKAGPPADPARAPDGRRCRGARDWRDARRTSSTVSRPALVSGAYTRSGRGRRDSTVPRAVDRAWRRQRRGNRGCLRRRRSPIRRLCVRSVSAAAGPSSCRRSSRPRRGFVTGSDGVSGQCPFPAHGLKAAQSLSHAATTLAGVLI